MSDPRWPDDGPNWPERDLNQQAEDEPWDEPSPSGDQPDLEREFAFPPAREPEPFERPSFDAFDSDAPMPPSEPEPEPEPAEEDGAGEVAGSPVVEAGEATTAFGAGWDPRVHGDRRRPTTAEQAVPWMIGIILALAGIVIVLLALIFTFPGGLSGSTSPSPTISPSPSASDPLASGIAGGSLPASPTPAATPSPTPAATPSPTPAPVYGPLEMVYLGRPSALAPIYLLRRDFSVAADPTIMAQADQGVASFAWSPDGRVGAAIIGGRAVALVPGQSGRALADSISELSFGWESDTVYAVRITRDGANDRTEILEIDFASGDASTLATITYPHPATAPEPALREAQFLDDGGLVRLFTTADGNLVLWILGAPSIYRIDPGDGRVTDAPREPILWAPDGARRIVLTENANGTTVIGLRDRDDETVASVQVTGLVSHVRWAGTSNEIVFTLGRLGSSGGVRQDLYVWDLVNGKAPMPLTSSGVAFGAEWLGVAPNWLP